MSYDKSFVDNEKDGSVSNDTWTCQEFKRPNQNRKSSNKENQKASVEVNYDSNNIQRVQIMLNRRISELQKKKSEFIKTEKLEKIKFRHRKLSV